MSRFIYVLLKHLTLVVLHCTKNSGHLTFLLCLLIIQTTNLPLCCHRCWMSGTSSEHINPVNLHLYLTIYPFIIYLPTCLPIYLFIHPSTYPSNYLFILNHDESSDILNIFILNAYIFPLQHLIISEYLTFTQFLSHPCNKLQM